MRLCARKSLANGTEISGDAIGETEIYAQLELITCQRYSQVALAELCCHEKCFNSGVRRKRQLNIRMDNMNQLRGLRRLMTIRDPSRLRRDHIRKQATLTNSNFTNTVLHL